MVFEHKVGDLFTTELPAMGHGVNVYGLMGAGIAKVVANLFPSVLPPYKEACKRKLLVPGGLQFVKTAERENFYVLNLASQDKPGKHARLEWLDSSLRSAVQFCQDEGLEGLAIPRIAAGIGGLDWESQVRPLMEQIASEYDDVMVEIWSMPDAD